MSKETGYIEEQREINLQGREFAIQVNHLNMLLDRVCGNCGMWVEGACVLWPMTGVRRSYSAACGNFCLADSTVEKAGEAIDRIRSIGRTLSQIGGE